MIRVKVSEPFIKKVMSEGMRSATIIEDAVPEDARLYRSWVDIDDGFRTLVLIFDDGEDEIVDLQPKFRVR